MNEHAVASAGAHARGGDVARFDAIVIGAGISGMFMLYRLRELGLSVRVFEAGTGVGGTWYWNRYPGARFDSESWTYGYAFSKELLAEWDWKEHFSPQPDTLEYLNYVADKFDLRRDMQFASTVKSAHFDDRANQWTVTLESGEQAHSQFLVTAVGVLSAHTLPAIPGRESFQGPTYHPARWPHTPVDFRSKRVGIIGTGATAIQAIPEIAKEAQSLTVFQRRPNWAAPLHNAKITKDEMEGIKARYDEIYAHCRQTSSWFIHQADPRRTFDVSPQERRAFWEKLYAEPGIWMGNFRDILTDEKANAAITEFIAEKIRQRVTNPAIADKLIPKDHGFGTRRVPLESGYFEAYNRPNVHLVDIRDDEPIICITPKGVKTTRAEYEFDILITATGFDGVTGAFDRIDLRGPGGIPLKDVWTDGQPRTFLGMLAQGFPNLLMVLGPHTARGNIPQAIEHCVEWQTSLLRFMQEHGLNRVEPRHEAVADWTETVIKASEALLSSKIDSWQTGVNRNVEGRTVRRVLGYNGNGVNYRRKTDEVTRGGFKELIFR
jgi:cation diffusion facilitator CzcD-associated flavoprotein CzcO